VGVRAVIGADGATAASTCVTWIGPKPTAGDSEPAASGFAWPGPLGTDRAASDEGGSAAIGRAVGWVWIGSAATGAAGRAGTGGPDVGTAATEAEPAAGREANGSEGGGGIGAVTAGIDGSNGAADWDIALGAGPAEATSAGTGTSAWIAPGATVSGGAPTDGVTALPAGAGTALTLAAWMGPKPTAGDAELVVPGFARPGPLDRAVSDAGGLSACGWAVGWAWIGIAATVAAGRTGSGCPEVGTAATEAQTAPGREADGSEGAGGIETVTAGVNRSGDAGDGDAAFGAGPAEGTSAGTGTPAWVTAGAEVADGAAADGATMLPAGAGAA
jgi:hypothetical protein